MGIPTALFVLDSGAMKGERRLFDVRSQILLCGDFFCHIHAVADLVSGVAAFSDFRTFGFYFPILYV